MRSKDAVWSLNRARKKCFLANETVAVSLRIDGSKPPIAEYDIAPDQDGRRPSAGICPGLSGGLPTGGPRWGNCRTRQEELLLHGL